MRKILIMLVAILILTVPVFADINQKSKLIGDNIVRINVDQSAWNSGSGDIDQNIGAIVTGNYQIISQDNTVFISDSNRDDYINNTLNGINLIRLDLSQYSKNKGSGNVAQGIEVMVMGNSQILDQDVIVAIAGE